ncbi:MAG TPA: cation-translocating P-type ATPase [Candidatus Brocadiia bacterium]|nr:cation-translocating P-type ATPase [Candidatus Brocadiia bacterium]
MIGRIIKLGIYGELKQSEDFKRVAFAGALALASYLWDGSGESASGSASVAGTGLALASVALNGAPIVWGAIKGLLNREVNVDELVSIAIVASLVSGEFLTAAVVSFVMVFGSLLEEATSNSARRAIQELVKMSPKTATVVIDGEPKTVDIKNVKVGDLLIVKPGEQVPVDALVREGISAVDESSMTGEPIPREKSAGDSVFAGTLNQNGVIRVTATKVGEDTTLGKVIKLVSEAEENKPETIRTIDRYARWFTPAMLTCAGVAWLVTGEVSRAVTVLIVGCPCALILAAPTAVVAAMGRAAKAGILVKGGVFLEAVARADVALFDKTGTLTEGKPKVDEIVSAEGVEKDVVLARAASVEQNSTHPLAHAVLKAAHYARVTIDGAEDMVAEIGLGLRARVRGRLVEVGSAYLGGGTMNVPVPLRDHLQRFREKGATPLVVYEEGKPLGVMSVQDHVRPDSKTTVERLKKLGFREISVLSGDHELSAKRVADQVGLTDAWSELKPQDKLNIIRKFQDEGRTVLFVGDGINDAPALAAANAGIAMGAGGTDVALETADIVLMHDDVLKIPFLVGLSRRMLRIIKVNIAFGMVFNAFAVIAGGAGYLSPIMGAVVHNIGSVLVVLSSASIILTPDWKDR